MVDGFVEEEMRYVVRSMDLRHSRVCGLVIACTDDVLADKVCSDLEQRGVPLDCSSEA